MIESILPKVQNFSTRLFRLFKFRADATIDLIDAIAGPNSSSLGNPTSFALSPGQAHDLDGADLLLPEIQAETVIADNGYDFDERVIFLLMNRNKNVVIPSRSNRKKPRHYDKALYKAMHLIENFFARLRPYRAIATRYDKTARNFLSAIYLAASIMWLN